jgi:hypothetical protein
MNGVSTIRDVIAYAKTTYTPLCVLSLDFRQAFYNLSHIYLYRILERYGICPWFIARIKMLYEGATARVHLNGTTVRHIPIQCGVRQGCPLSMALYALCLHPFVKRLHDNLVGIKMGRLTVGTKVIAYADDVTVFVTNPCELAAVQQAVILFQRATGAKLNPGKQKHWQWAL